MKRAYVDTSALVALHFREKRHAEVSRLLRAHDQLLSVGLVTAEMLATLQREGRRLDEADALLRRLTLYSPDGALRAECEEALAAGPLRGADLWHLAAALSLAGKRQRAALPFCSLDQAQRNAARALGFPLIPAA